MSYFHYTPPVKNVKPRRVVGAGGHSPLKMLWGNQLNLFAGEFHLAGLVQDRDLRSDALADVTRHERFLSSALEDHHRSAVRIDGRFSPGAVQHQHAVAGGNPVLQKIRIEVPLNRPKVGLGEVNEGVNQF